MQQALERAWWHYWTGNYEAMCIALLASAHQASPTEQISHWIESFQTVARQRKHFFEVDSFTGLPEWNALLEKILKVKIQSADIKGCPNKSPSFVLYRTLGSDLPPRHYTGQTLANLQFILNHEPPLHRCQKRWVVNRIVNAEQEKKILATLEAHHQTYRHIPFNGAEYAKASYDFESFEEPDFLRSPTFKRLDRNSQIWACDRPYRPKKPRCHQPQRRPQPNFRRGPTASELDTRPRRRLFYDSKCLASATQRSANLQTSGLSRWSDSRTTSSCFSTETIPPPTEEPQIAVHQSSKVRFDESLQYGRFTKVELFRRLKVPGRLGSVELQTLGSTSSGKLHLKPTIG